MTDTIRRGIRGFGCLVVASAFAGLGWLIASELRGDNESVAAKGERPAVAIEVADVARGRIVARRTFHGSLRARVEFSAAAKVSGHVSRVHVDVGDSIERGTLIAELDDAAANQDVLEAEAEVAVAKARLAQARSAVTIVRRELDRVLKLGTQGLTSDQELDTKKSELEAMQAAEAVAESEVEQRKAQIEAARIRSEYTRVHAIWNDGTGPRIVGARHVDEGDNVVAHQPIVDVLDIATLVAVVTATEADYGALETGQSATMTTDAFPGRSFPATIVRKAVSFRIDSRQADIELHAENPDGALRPGMFVRVTVELGRNEDALIVPQMALATREGKVGLFLLDDSGETVRWQPVQTGIVEGDRVQILDPPLAGRVVTLGQQLLSDGSRITIPGSGESQERERDSE